MEILQKNAIEVRNNETRYGRNIVKVDNYFTTVGMISLPDEQELQRLISEI